MDLKTPQIKTLIILHVIAILSAGCINSESSEIDEPQIMPPEYLDMANLRPSSSASIENGKAQYAKTCENCHGPDGLGDGAQAHMYEPKPSNLRDAHMQSKSDGELFYWVTAGMKGTSMPPFRGLSDDDRWDIVNYMRTFEVTDDAESSHSDKSAL